jgi:hypothetical protein
MNQYYVRDAGGTIKGTIIMNNGDATALDKDGRVVGTYRESTNTTIDFNGHVIGEGNMLPGLVRFG